MSILVSSIFCDDIRQEMGGKQSLMGVYNGHIIVPEFPVTLPKLCVQIQVRFAFTERPDELIIKLSDGDAVIAEATVSEADMSAMFAGAEEDRDNMFMVVGVVFVLMPMHIPQSTILRGRVYIKGIEHKGNGIRVRAGTPSEVTGVTAASEPIRRLSDRSLTANKDMTKPT